MGDDTTETPEATDAPEATDPSDVRVWLVERTYSDDELNLIILTYATPDGRREYRQERALTGAGDRRETPASRLVSPDDLASVDDPETRDRYANEVDRLREGHGPEDAI